MGVEIFDLYEKAADEKVIFNLLSGFNPDIENEENITVKS
jgi:hypothetical protein